MVLGFSSDSGLKKTSGEKIILKNIHSLEESIASENDSDKKDLLGEQLEELKSHLDSSSGKSYTDLRLENQGLRKQLEKLRGQFVQTKINTECVPCDGTLDIYKILLKRHAERISKAEEKTVGEIKAFINSDDLTIQSISQNFKQENYDFEKHYIQAAEKAFNYVRDTITFVKPEVNVSFWLTPKEIASKKIGDDEDQATFLCSLLFALGDTNAEVVVAEMSNGKSHAFVISEFQEKFILLDPSQKHEFRDFFGEKKDVLEAFVFDEAHIKRFLYRFNHEKYEQFQEE